MVDKNCKHNAAHLAEELDWFKQVVVTRYQLFHHQKCKYSDISEVPVPELNNHSSIYKQVLDDLDISWEERLILIMTMMPNIKPHLLDGFLQEVFPQNEASVGKQNAGFVPTVEEAFFILAGDDLEKRFSCEPLFDQDAPLIKNGVIELIRNDHGTSNLDYQLTLSHEYRALFTHGKQFRPTFGHAFPAKLITTGYQWKDLVLDQKTAGQIHEIKAWIKHGKTLIHDWGMGSRIAPGYKCLFYGQPGTGKTMTAALLGKSFGHDVYRIDLSLVISKYIGETEKNLRHVFDTAENKDWILFFDEADALFGKRTEVKDAHDRFANQEVAYLLQRIEEHPGVVILATNMKNNLDDAFTRRFQNMINFPMPVPEERLKIWQNGFSKSCVREESIDLKQIAEKYELSGGAIMNVIRYASLMALEAGCNEITLKDIFNGIQREYMKEGRSL